MLSLNVLKTEYQRNVMIQMVMIQNKIKKFILNVKILFKIKCNIVKKMYPLYTTANHPET